MLILILAIVIALVAWSLHLMQEAIEHHEFSLMLAGTLVAFAAAALVGVYFLMGDYMGYMARVNHHSTAAYQMPDYDPQSNVQFIVSSSD